MILILILFVVILILFVTTLIVAWDKIIAGKVPFISLPQKTLEEIISYIPILSSDVFYDLGCGDGRVLLLAAKKQPNAQFVGIEKAIFPYFLAKLKCRRHKNIKILWGDITKVNIAGASIVFIYLLPELTSKIISKLKNKNVVVVEYPLDIKPSKTIKLKNKTALVSELFFYRNTSKPS